jgi:hypothetical protein
MLTLFHMWSPMLIVRQVLRCGRILKLIPLINVL